MLHLHGEQFLNIMGRERYNAKGNPKIIVQDGGSPILTALLSVLNFAGAGVTVTEGAAGEAIITIPGGGGGGGNPFIGVDDQGTPILTGPLTNMDFVGSGITVIETAAGLIQITVAGTTRGGNGLYFKSLGSHNFTKGEYDVLEIASNGESNVSFSIPADLTSLNSALITGIPNNTNAAASITLTTDYASAGENYQTHQETNNIVQAMVANQLFEMDISSVINSIVAGDRVGLLIDHNAIGGAVGYINLVLDYN